MKRLLVTGGSGMLGQHIVAQLTNKTDYTVRIMSRKAQPSTLQPQTEWAQADLESSRGLAEAVKDINVIIHAASNSTNSQQADVVGTKNLLQEARTSGVSHIIYVSIVGIDRIPFPYYKKKLEAEEIIKNSGIPWSILRATQFHSFIDILLQVDAKIPLISLLPTDFKTQPVYEGEVAERLVEMTSAEPGGYAPEIAGPEVLTLGTMARAWIKSRGLRRLIVPLWLPGKIAQGFRRGYNISSGEHIRGSVCWADWLQQTTDEQVRSVYGKRYLNK